MKKLLIANRGEIAVRVARAARELGIATVAVASEADRAALHARTADEVVEIGPAPARESYLRADRLIEVARERGCDAVHPGYGFLSQSAAFADAVARAGLVFVGPPAAAIRLMGDKTAARRTMAAAGVPIVPGDAGEGTLDPAALARAAAETGFPVLLKAAAGGGGKGMRIVRAAGELAAAAESARREAEKAFGDGRLFVEKWIEDARHVEIQVLADAHGACVHLFERECSVQRRYQKIVEESPSPALDAALRARMGEAAVAAARACGYVNAGTIEFLLGRDRSFYFLEMNTRLQVEHPVTELVTGVDIVEWQLRIAAGEPLGFGQADLVRRGHAIECRVNAEDPGADFAPSTGRVLLAAWPGGPGVRVDAGVETGDEVPIHYDPLIAKVIVHAETRTGAIRRMEEALARTAVLGISTNIGYLRAVLAHPVFREGEATTSFVTRELAAWRPPPAEPGDAALAAMAIAEVLAADHAANGGAPVDAAAGDRTSPWARADGYRVGGG
jgi:acetyl-CoA carboxylase biotin carboxylase subunit